MKNFSLKALGAFIFAAGLVVAGVAAPANAADMTSGATATATGSIASTGTNAYPITVTATTVSPAVNAGLSKNTTYYVNLPSGWTFVTPGFAQTCASLGVNVTITPSFSVFDCGKTNGATAYLEITNDMAAGIPASTTFTVEFPAHSLNVSSSRAFTVKNTSSLNATPLDTGTATLAAAPASYPIGYNGNGSTSGSVSSPSTSSGSLTLPSNGYSKTGFTFSGWRVGNASSGTVYQPGDTATGITGPTLVYAQWTASSSGGGSGSGSSSSSSSSDSLANTGINSATGISLLAGGLSLALVGAEMFMIARRKRSN